MATPAEETQQNLQPATEDEDEPQRPPWMTLDSDSDTKTPVSTEVSGKIPKWLSGGNLYLNGPGVFCVGDQWLEHLYDGFAIIHRFQFQEGGVVYYQPRILNSDAWVRSCEAKQPVTSQFGTTPAFTPDPSKSLVDRMKSLLLPMNADDMTDNTPMNVVRHGANLYALSDNATLNQLHPETLMRHAKVDLKQTLPIHLMSAIPHFGADGTMYSLTTTFGPTSTYGIVAIPPPPQPAAATTPTKTPPPPPPSPSEAATTEDDSVFHEDSAEDQKDVFQRASLLVSLPSRFKVHISYGHSFGMSSGHFVILEQSIAMNTVKVLTSNWRRDGYASSFAKFPEDKIALHVIRRSDNQRLPVTFEADPGFCFHFVNCHETGEYLVVDLCCHDDVDVIDGAFLDKLTSGGQQDPSGAMLKQPQASFRRFVLPINVTEADAEVNLVSMADTKATAHMLTPGVIHCCPDYITDDKILMDMPRINYEACNGNKYRYVYGTTLHDGEQRLVKVDVEKRRTVLWQQKGYSAGEPVFVARPGAKAEDDGVVLSALLSELPHTPSFLAVLDAQSFKELGRAIIPCHVPLALSFHGTFVPGTQPLNRHKK